VKKSLNNPKTVSGAELDRAVWSLRVRGYRVSEIARRLQKPYSTVRSSYKRGLERAVREAAEDAGEYRRQELQLIDDAMKIAMSAVDSGNLSAIDRMLALQARRARYVQGLEVPREETHNHNHRTTAEVIDALERAYEGPS
jgi:hypothetical protein